MRIVPFPQPAGTPREPTPAELEAALHGDAVGPGAEYWRDMRAAVRALAPALPPELEQRLRERIGESADRKQRREPAHRGVRSRISHALGWLGSGGPMRAAAVLGPVIAAAIVTLALVDPWHSGPIRSELSTPRSGQSQEFSGAARPYAGAPGAVTKATAENVTRVPLAHPSAAVASGATSPSAAASAAAAASAPARVQQRAASITLAPKPEGVQSVADQVAQLAARDGGFVQSSQVNLQQGTGGEANVQLSLPSARLSAALASLASLAPTRAESQSLQDITDEYAAAQRKLSDAVAERQALLRALAKASTQGEIESLRARLSLAGGAIARASSAFQSVSKRAGNSAVEVTVLGDAHAGAGRSTLSTALRDAGDVLKVALAALIVALAVLVPLALLGLLVAGVWRTSRRRLRERALG